jgi:serine/threonine protein kinase
MNEQDSIFEGLKTTGVGGTQTPEEMAIQLAKVNYTLNSIIGSGWITEVVRSQGPHGEVAVKVLNRAALSDQRVKERFILNAQHNAQLAQNTSFPISDINEIEGQPFYTMPIIGTGNLFSIIEKHAPLDIEWTLGILKGIAYQIDFAHSISIFHANIKPSNILITVDKSNDEKGMLVDYSHPSTIFSRSALEGPGIYTPPEVYSNVGYDARSDIFSFACVLYHALTGSSPFGPTIDGDGECIPWHADEPPKHFSVLRPDITVNASDYIMSALSKDPEKRPTSASALVDGVEDAIRRSKNQNQNLLVKQPGKVPIALIIGGVALAALVALFIVIKILGGGGENSKTNPKETKTTQPSKGGTKRDDVIGVLKDGLKDINLDNCKDVTKEFVNSDPIGALGCDTEGLKSIKYIQFDTTQKLNDFLANEEVKLGEVQTQRELCIQDVTVKNKWGQGTLGEFICDGKSNTLFWTYDSQNVAAIATANNIAELDRWWSNNVTKFPS